jgi:broad specificity phosphatase PhoE
VTELLLARHGETDWNRAGRFQGYADPPLNELGRRQAGELAAALVGRSISAIYASDLRRAAETAAIVGERIALRPTLLEDLREADVGDLTALTREEIPDRFPEAARAATENGFAFASGEGYEALAARVLSSVREIARRHPDESVLVITHGGPLRAILAHADGMSLCEHRQQHAPAGNCAVYRLEVENGEPRRID